MTERFTGTLAQWLERVEQLHPVEIDLGLERVRQVHGRLGLPSDIATAIIVAGTNGKGSTVAYLEAIYQAAGYRTGAYTSPHLQRYNERIRVAGNPVDDDEIVAAFACIEAARMGVSLTYFEYGTLAALLIFQQREVEVFILEVGMGGRLDAVNVINAPVSIVSSIGLDHQSWLGNDRETIAIEKAGVFRNGQTAVIGDLDPPQTLIDVATQSTTRLLRLGKDFGFTNQGQDWSWQGSVIGYDALPLPGFGGSEQLANAACALAAVEQLNGKLRTDSGHVIAGLRTANLSGRYQVVKGRRNWILDVAHNGEAAKMLAASLQGFSGRTIAVIGMMNDKPVEAIAQALDQAVDEWIAIDSGNERSLPVTELSKRLSAIVNRPVSSAMTLTDGLTIAAKTATAADRILVTGSFRVVGPALEYLSRHA